VRGPSSGAAGAAGGGGGAAAAATAAAEDPSGADGGSYAWRLVTRRQCSKGCSGPTLRPIQASGCSDTVTGFSCGSVLCLSMRRLCSSPQVGPNNKRQGSRPPPCCAALWPPGQAGGGRHANGLCRQRRIGGSAHAGECCSTCRQHRSCYTAHTWDAVQAGWTPCLQLQYNHRIVLCKLAPFPQDPRHLWLSVDEACSHVGANAFRLVAGIYDASGAKLLGTAVSPPIR